MLLYLKLYVKKETCNLYHPIPDLQPYRLSFSSLLFSEIRLDSKSIVTNTGNGVSSSTRKSPSCTEAPPSFHLSASSLFFLVLQPRTQKFCRLRRPVQQCTPLRHCQKRPISPITHDIIQHLLQQLPKQCLRVRRRRSFLGVIVTRN